MMFLTILVILVAHCVFETSAESSITVTFTTGESSAKTKATFKGIEFARAINNNSMYLALVLTWEVFFSSFGKVVNTEMPLRDQGNWEVVYVDIDGNSRVMEIIQVDCKIYGRQNTEVDDKTKTGVAVYNGGKKKVRLYHSDNVDIGKQERYFYLELQFAKSNQKEFENSTKAV